MHIIVCCKSDAVLLQKKLPPAYKLSITNHHNHRTRPILCVAWYASELCGDLQNITFSFSKVHWHFPTYIFHLSYLHFSSFHHYRKQDRPAANQQQSYFNISVQQPTTFLRFGKFGKSFSEVSPLLLSVSVSRLVYCSVSPAIWLASQLSRFNSSTCNNKQLRVSNN